MSHEDIKKEYKQSEGDPHIKGHRRQLAHELLNQAPTAPPKPVEDADMLVVNPTHYAVALYYRPGQTPLPLIHCKGEDDDALALIDRAKSRHTRGAEHLAGTHAVQGQTRQTHPAPDLAGSGAHLSGCAPA